MNDDELFRQAEVTYDGAVCLDESVVCDGYKEGFDTAVFTHIHSDHVTERFGTCLHRCCVYASKTTLDMIEALTGSSYKIHTQVHRMQTGEPVMLRRGSACDYVELFDSNHVLGASQVLLTMSNKLKILYSGDIAPGDSPPECNVLVIDSTHGSPIYDKRIDASSLGRRLADAVVESIEGKRPVRIHAHRGRLQEIMHLLSSDSRIPHDTIRFLCSGKDMRLAQVYARNGMEIRGCMDVGSYEGEAVLDSDLPWIEFTTSTRISSKEEDGRVTPISVLGRPGKTTMAEHGTVQWFAPDEHAEFSQILEYVNKARPQVVVTDGDRSKYGQELADHISSKLGIKAKTSPRRADV